MRRMCSQTRFRSKPVWFNTLISGLCLALLLTAMIAYPAKAQSDGGLSPEAQRIYDMVNQARIDNGLPPLALNAQLTLAAQSHVDDVIAHGNWGHYGSDGSTVAMRTARAGYGSSWVSENWVAASTPDQAMNWWLNDWIHRVNILTGHWNEIGVGVAPAGNGFWIFVTDFGNGDGTGIAVAQAIGASLRISVIFRYDWAGVWLWLVLATAIAVAASLSPAQQAIRMSVQESLAYE